MPRKSPNLVSVGYDGRFEQGFKEVVDPYESDKTLVAAVNVRIDIIEHLFSRRWIGEHHRRAGNEFLRIVQTSEAATGLAIDPTKEPVDGKGDTTGVIVNRLKAALELRRIRQELGSRDYWMARQMIGCDPSQEPFSQRERDYRNRRFRDILTDLAQIFGYMGKTRDVG